MTSRVEHGGGQRDHPQRVAQGQQARERQPVSHQPGVAAELLVDPFESFPGCLRFLGTLDWEASTMEEDEET